MGHISTIWILFAYQPQWVKGVLKYGNLYFQWQRFWSTREYNPSLGEEIYSARIISEIWDYKPDFILSGVNFKHNSTSPGPRSGKKKCQWENDQRLHWTAALQRGKYVCVNFKWTTAKSEINSYLQTSEHVLSR